MIDPSKISQEVKIPGIYAYIEESVAIAETSALEIGRTPTAILDAPDFIYVADTEFGGNSGVKPVRITDNTVYVVEDPAEFLATIKGEIFAEGSLTQEQLDAMRAPDLENALEIAIENELKFAFVKMVKRDGTRPDMNNLYEVYQAYETTKDSLSVVNVGTVVPFGTSIQDVFEISDKEASASLSIKVGEAGAGKLYEKYSKFVFPNKYELDIEKALTGKISFELIDYGAATTGDVSSEMEAAIYYENAAGVKKLIAEEVAVDFDGSFAFDNANLSVDAVILRENATVTVEEGEIELVFNAGTLVATIAVDDKGNIIKNASGVAVTNYDLTVATPDAATPIGVKQNFAFEAVVSTNPYVQVKSIIDPEYKPKIQIVQGFNDDDLTKNFAPEQADSFVLTFALDDTKKKVTVNVGLGDEKEAVGTGTVEPVDGIYSLTEEVEVEVATGVTVQLGIGLKVHDDSAKVDADLGDSIYYNLAYEVENQPSYVINVVPYQARFCDLWATFAHANTFNLDETRVVLSAGAIISDGNGDKKKFVKELERLAVRGSMKLQLSASNVQDLGKYICVPTGSLKSVNGVGGFKADTTFRIYDYGRTNGGAGEIEESTNIIVLQDGSGVRKGDKVEITTVKSLSKVTFRTTVESVSAMVDGSHKVIVTDKVDTTKFNLDAYEVSFSLINKKDLKGNYLAFQYAIYSETFDNKTPVRKVIPGTSECTFSKALIERLDAAGYTVINNDPTSKTAFIENTPTMAAKGNQFDDQIALGTTFHLLKKLREIGRAFQGVNMNKAENQSSYSDRVKAVKTAALNDALVTAITITPDYRFVAQGKITAKMKFTTAETLKEILYYSQINE